MDTANLVPFGKVDRYLKPRRLGKKEPHVRASVIARWEIISPVFAAPLATIPQLRNRLQEAINQRGREIQIQKSEFDQLGNLLGTISDAWSAFLTEVKKNLHDRLETWYQGSRRGMFRLLVLLAGMGMEGKTEKAGQVLRSKGYGGHLKNALLQASSGSMDAKPGSLYVALKDFVSDGLIINYDLETNDNVKVSKKGKAFILAALAALKRFLDLLSKVGLLPVLAQEHVNNAKNINDGILGIATQQVDMASLMQNVTRFQGLIELISAAPAFKDVHDENVKDMVEAWQDNVNRGIIDVFILGRLLSRPSYGNALILEAEEALDIPTGTLYPKLKELATHGLIQEITDVERLNMLKKAESKTQGPPKIYYDCTATGALYLMAITSLYLADLTVFFKFTQDLLESVAVPVSPPKPK